MDKHVAVSSMTSKMLTSSPNKESIKIEAERASPTRLRRLKPNFMDDAIEGNIK